MSVNLEFSSILKAFLTPQGIFGALLVILGMWVFACGLSGKFHFGKLLNIPIPARPKSKRQNVIVGGLLTTLFGLILISNLNSDQPKQIDSKGEIVKKEFSEVEESPKVKFWLGKWNLPPSEVTGRENGFVVKFGRSKKGPVMGTIYDRREEKFGYFTYIKFSEVADDKIIGKIGFDNGRKSLLFHAQPISEKEWKCFFSEEEDPDDEASFIAWRE